MYHKITKTFLTAWIRAGHCSQASAQAKTKHMPLTLVGQKQDCALSDEPPNACESLQLHSRWQHKQLLCDINPVFNFDVTCNWWFLAEICIYPMCTIGRVRKQPNLLARKGKWLLRARKWTIKRSPCCWPPTTEACYEICNKQTSCQQTSLLEEKLVRVIVCIQMKTVRMQT